MGLRGPSSVTAGRVREPGFASVTVGCVMEPGFRQRHHRPRREPGRSGGGPGHFLQRSAPADRPRPKSPAFTGYNFLYREVRHSRQSPLSSDLPLQPDARSGAGTVPFRHPYAGQPDRMQVILSPSPRRPESFARIRGQVLDAVTGDRLAFATVSWTTDGALRGVAADSDARFVLPGEATSAGPVVLTASYVGYDPAGRQR